MFFCTLKGWKDSLKIKSKSFGHSGLSSLKMSFWISAMTFCIATFGMMALCIIILRIIHLIIWWRLLGKMALRIKTLSKNHWFLYFKKMCRCITTSWCVSNNTTTYWFIWPKGEAGNTTNWAGRLSTVDPLVKVTCFYN